MPHGRVFLSSASGKKEFAFLAAEKLKITPLRIRNTYPVDVAYYAESVRTAKLKLEQGKGAWSSAAFQQDLDPDFLAGWYLATRSSAIRNVQFPSCQGALVCGCGQGQCGLLARW